MSKWVDNITKFIILGIWTLISFFLFLTSIVQTVDLKGMMEISFSKDNIIVQIISLMIFSLICVLLSKNKFLSSVFGVKNKKLMIFSSLITLAFLFVWISITQWNPASDQMLCFQYANEMLSGNYESWIRGYMSIYPFQNGLVLLDALLIKIFGNNGYLALQCINAVFFVLGAISIYKTFMVLNENCGGIMPLTLLFYYPYAMYVTFCYGTMIGFSLSVMAIMWLVEYFKARNLKFMILSGLFISAAIIIKPNYLIVLVAIVLYTIYDLIKRKDKNNIVGLAIIIIMYIFSTFAINKVVGHITKHPVENGIPKIAWVAMGFRDAVNTPGWFDNYNSYVYEKNDRDSKATINECKEMILRKTLEFKKSPKYGIKFFYKKITSQWNNPTLQCFSIQSLQSGTGENIVKKMISEQNNQPIKNVLNVIQSILNFGILMYVIFQWMNFKTANVYEWIFAVLTIGAFIFFIFWEADGQYIAPYYYMSLPYSVLGWKKIVRFVETKYEQMGR